jgi:tetratricopeptide (TPR) repeat protein
VPDPRAFDLYMRAGRESFAGTAASFRKGVAYAEEAVRIDPDYADAWVMLARLTHGMFDSGYDSDPIWLSRSVAANARARVLDPGHPEALSMAGASHLLAGRTLEAWAALSEAHRRLPNESVTIHYLAYLYRLCGMVDAFVAAELRAIELEPGAPWPYWSLSRVALERGDLAEGRAWDERARQRFPDLQATWNRTWNLWVFEGRAEEALRAMDQAADRLGTDPHLTLTRATAFAFLGRADEARAQLLLVDSAVRLDMDFAAYAAAITGMGGDLDAAFGWLERAYELGNSAVYKYENPQLFGALHGDPRWAEFITRVRQRSADLQREVRWPVPA